MGKRKRRQIASAVEGVVAATHVGQKSPGLLVQARYDAAGQGRRMIGWNAPSSGPNRAIAGLANIRNRSRDAVRNEWAGASAVRVMKTNLVGTGIVARPRTKNKTLKAKLAAEWDRFCEACDADGVLDFAGLQVLATGSWMQSGECFIRQRPRRLYDGLPVPMQVQVLESDMLPMLDADAWPDMKVGNVIRSGIEIDRVGRRVAFWFYRQHPGDPQGGIVSMTELTRVPAEQVIHVYRPDRPGQLRGVPDSAPILAKMRALMDFDDATLERQRIANLFAMFLKRPMPTGDSAIDPLTGKTVETNAAGQQLAALEPGISQELLPGEDVTFSDPPDAGANYAEFMREQTLGMSAGQGIPHELLTGDLRDISDRVLRITINEFRRYCEQLQWTIIIPKMCKGVRAWWSRAAILSGSLTEAEAAEALNVEWQPQAWARIHPTQDVQAEQMEVENGFRSRSSVIASRGEDPEKVDEERAEDKQRADGLGLTPPPPKSAANPGEQKDDLQDGDESAGRN